MIYAKLLPMSELENKREYEMAYLLAPDISEENIDLETSELKKVISENGGESIESNIPKKRWLAYSVKKQAQAYFGVIYFNTDKENIDVVKKSFSFNKKVLRFLIINKPIKKQETIIATPLESTVEKTPESTAPSFDQKLESILRG